MTPIARLAVFRQIQSNFLLQSIKYEKDAATAVVIKHFHTNDGVMDIEKAKSESVLSKIAAELKRNIRLVEQTGILVIPQETKSMGELPEKDIIAGYRQLLSNDFTIDVLLGNHAVSAKAEIMLLDEAFHKKISV